MSDIVLTLIYKFNTLKKGNGLGTVDIVLDRDWEVLGWSIKIVDGLLLENTEIVDSVIPRQVNSTKQWRIVVLYQGVTVYKCISKVLADGL